MVNPYYPNYPNYPNMNGYVQPTQSRYDQMYTPPVQPTAPTPNIMKCRAVTSQEEARAAMIDLDGSVSVFTDFGNNKIYTKQIKLDGTAELKTYEEVKEKEDRPQVTMPNMREYVKQDELDTVYTALNEKISDFSDRIYDLETSIENVIKEKATKGAKK